MELEKQVCSLELAKKLKELGVKRDSIHGWMHTRPFVSAPAGWKIRSSSAPEKWEGQACPAYTVAELGEMLPLETVGQPGHVSFSVQNGKRMSWWFGDGHMEEAETEADARAKMLVYLIENRLIGSIEQGNMIDECL